jgi:hypothetical protein
MNTVQRNEILDYQTYEEQRDAIRTSAIAAKEARRVVVAEFLTFLFENQETVRYQVLEMVRTERLVKEGDIAHELQTYNELLGGSGELGCTLLIGIPDPADRDVKLREWIGLLPHLYVELDDGTRVRPKWDERQIGRDRLSSVQFLKFDVKGKVPRAAGSDFPGLSDHVKLLPHTRTALARDLGI